MIAQEKLFLAEDRLRVVKEGSAEAAFLLAPKGLEIPKRFEPLVSALYAALTVEPSPIQVATKETALPARRRR